MDYWNKDLPNAKEYLVEFEGLFEGETCVEAKASSRFRTGWIRRVWTIDGGLFVAPHQKERTFYGKVHIVRVK
jgi:hypothetical protein